MFRRQQTAFQSGLFNQETFDAPFMRDMRCCQQSLVIESPFIRLKRVDALMPVFRKLRQRDVRIVINTRDPIEHDEEYAAQAKQTVAALQSIGVEVLYTVRHHRKLAIIDRAVVWEGSLNILSYYDSCEIMRRIASAAEAEALINFIGLQKYLQNVS
ncbi:MAG TPA: phospholipase D-like domain-containing protein [Candidatus Saccharimonadales bacterium]|nr:phospholipase D-like domain-containing protein [Candidatus Saccharimonadales bacterium]